MSRKAVVLRVVAGAAVAAASIALFPSLALAAPGAASKPCRAGGDRYDVTSTFNNQRFHKGVGAPQGNTNNTSHDITSHFTSKITGTVKMAVTAEVSVKEDVIISSASAKAGVSLEGSMTAELGNSVDVKTPAHRTTLATFGVNRLKTSGNYITVSGQCHETVNSATAETPWFVGWKFDEI